VYPAGGSALTFTVERRVTASTPAASEGAAAGRAAGCAPKRGIGAEVAASGGNVGAGGGAAEAYDTIGWDTTAGAGATGGVGIHPDGDFMAACGATGSGGAAA